MESPSPRSRLPEGFDELLGDRAYISPAPWEWHEDGDRVLLRPRARLHPVQWVTGLVLVPGFCFAFYWFLADSQTGASSVILNVSCVAIPILVMAGFLVHHGWQKKRGPWIDFDRASRTLRLPRVPLEIPADGVYLVQVISGFLAGGNRTRRVYEVNAIVLEDAAEPGRPAAKRYPVVGAGDGATARGVSGRLRELLGKIPDRGSGSASS